MIGEIGLLTDSTQQSVVIFHTNTDIYHMVAMKKAPDVNTIYSIIKELRVDEEFGLMDVIGECTITILTRSEMIKLNRQLEMGLDVVRMFEMLYGKDGDHIHLVNDNKE